MDLFERFVVIHVWQVQRSAAERDIAGNALGRNGQLQVAAAAEPGFNLGNNRRLVLINRIEGEPVGIEQFADVLAGLQHDLLKVFRVVDASSNVVQLAIKQGLKGHAPFFRRLLLRFKKCLL